MSESLRPQVLYSPRNSLGQNTGVGSLSLPQGNLSNPGMEPRSPALQADSLPAESQRKPTELSRCTIIQLLEVAVNPFTINWD